MEAIIRLEDEDLEALERFLYYKKICGDLNPEFDPVDSVALAVALSAGAGHPVTLEPGTLGRSKRLKNLRERIISVGNT